jgi:hypothetical protein
MGVYPNRGILDCGFSALIAGGRQHSIHISRTMTEHELMTAGPLRIDVLEPMRRIRVTLDENNIGLACHLLFTTRSAAIQEPRQILWSGTRRTTDATRYNQFGKWQGVIQTPDGTITVDETLCLGIKDRSWGIRRFGEPEPEGPIKGHRPSFLWAPIFWDGHISHAIFLDGANGEAFVRDGVVAPLYPTVDSVPGVEEHRGRRMATVRHRLAYGPGTRWAQSAKIDLVDQDNHMRTMRLEPILRFQQKGIGYGHPKWGHGLWRGELSIEHDSFDLPRSIPWS